MQEYFNYRSERTAYNLWHMLNISGNTISPFIKRNLYKSFQRVESRRSGRVLVRVLLVLLGAGIIILLLPWTQNIRSHGRVTTLRPDQRPQTVHSIIAGRIEKWFVKEGDFVRKGDTILYISEIKDAYFDPQLLSRTEDQLKSKELSVKSYMEKVKALDGQIDALVQNSKLKLKQARNKLSQARLSVVSDSIDYRAAQIKRDIAQEQYRRMRELYNKGLKSETDLENRELTMQKAQADMIAAENKFLKSRNEVINAEVEINATQADYRDKIAKAEADKYAAMSGMYDAETVVTKLQNEYMNYSVRKGMYYISAPQDGYVTKAIQQGIGETVKEGEQIVSIMPSNYELAVAMYVNPIDLPLVKVGHEVRIQFDGWPAIVFSGWPNTSYGTYGGRVYAIDRFISDNGKYRVLVIPDEQVTSWPEALRVGSGTNNMMLLSDVPIWYELWRKINGFPPDFYKELEDKTKEKS